MQRNGIRQAVVSRYPRVVPRGGKEATVLITRLLLCLVLATPAVAREPFSWIGQMVVTKYDYPIKIGNQVVPAHGFHVDTVNRTNGDSLWVVSGVVEGWIPASQVVPFDWAIDLYTQEIMAHPGNSAAWNHRGTIWREMKQYDKAIADYNESIRLDPKDADARVNLGIARHDKEEYDKAIANHKEAIRLDARDADAHGYLDIPWRSKKESDKAIAALIRVFLLDFTLGRARNSPAWRIATCIFPDLEQLNGK
jgi:TPR repeat